MYMNPIFRVKNNGYISKTCSMEKGIRQGCPASAIIFILVAEVMACKIRENDNIKGFKTNDMNEDIKIVQHADDATLPLADIKSAENAVKIIKEFGSMSGMKLNIDKTECLLTGSFKDNYTDIAGVKVSTNVKCLGVYFGYDAEYCLQRNWYDKIRDLEKTLNLWKKRKLTLFGKTAIINTLALSKLYYSATILNYPPLDVIKKINSAIFGFIWQKRDHIKRNTIIGKLNEGGIGLVDIETKFKALKAAWVPRIMFKTCHINNFLSTYFEKGGFDCNFVLKTNVTHFPEIRRLLKHIPMFYIEMLSAFNECKLSTANLNSDQFLSQPIWNNKMFKFKGKSLYFKNWIKSGFLYVKDLFIDGEFKDISVFRDSLTHKHNYILKNVFNAYVQKYDVSKSQYINVQRYKYDLFYGNVYDYVQGKKCKFFYNLLLSKKFVKPHLEKKMV